MTKTISIGLVLLATAIASRSVRAADEAVPGKFVIVKPGSLAKFIATPASGGLFTLPSGASDPTVGGGELRFFKGDREDVFALPVQAAPRGWKGLGSPAGSKGFKYKGAGTTTDPCKTVLVKTKILKATCRGGAVKLDPPANGPVGILLSVGATPRTYLALYGGSEISNTAELLKRKDAPVPPACDCGATTPTELRFANGVGTGVCGNATDGTVTRNFDCGKLVIGGGSSPVPTQVFQDMVDPARLKVTECSGKNLIVGKTTSAETGSNRQCTDINCLFAPPLPIILPSTPQSACVYMRVSRPGRGTVQCDTGDASIDMDILGAMFLTGDILLNRCVGGTNPGAKCGVPGAVCLGGGSCTADAAVEPCPICNPSTLRCNGGFNGMGSNGMVCTGGGNQPCSVDANCPPLQTCITDTVNAPDTDAPCTPGAQAVTGAQFPTSHDCTVSTVVFIGDIPIPFQLSTGTTVRKTFSSHGQSHVFCGFCRDEDLSGCFEGDTDPMCPPSGSQFHPCSSDGECAQPFEACQQHSNGGFGPGGGSYTTATEIGTVAGSLEDFAPHASTLAGIFCIPPTHVGLVNASSDLPGPGAVALAGTLQLSPGGAFIDGMSLP